MTELLLNKAMTLAERAELKALAYLMLEAKINGRKLVYIAGKVDDLSIDSYYNDVLMKFAHRAEELRSLNHVPVNPMEFVKRGTDWHTAMRICLRVLSYCDAISPLSDYKESPGATIEVNLATELQLLFIYPSKINSL